jgi:hypothetical protein
MISNYRSYTHERRVEKLNRSMKLIWDETSTISPWDDVKIADWDDVDAALFLVKIDRNLVIEMRMSETERFEAEKS